MRALQEQPKFPNFIIADGITENLGEERKQSFLTILEGLKVNKSHFEQALERIHKSISEELIKQYNLIAEHLRGKQSNLDLSYMN